MATFTWTGAGLTATTLFPTAGVTLGTVTATAVTFLLPDGRTLALGGSGFAVDEVTGLPTGGTITSVAYA